MTNTLAIKLGLPELPGKVETRQDCIMISNALNIQGLVSNGVYQTLLTLENQRREGIEIKIEICLDFEKYGKDLSLYTRLKEYLESTLNLKWAVIKKAYEGEE